MTRVIPQRIIDVGDGRRSNIYSTTFFMSRFLSTTTELKQNTTHPLEVRTVRRRCLAPGERASAAYLTWKAPTLGLDRDDLDCGDANNAPAHGGQAGQWPVHGRADLKNIVGEPIGTARATWRAVSESYHLDYPVLAVAAYNTGRTPSSGDWPSRAERDRRRSRRDDSGDAQLCGRRPQALPSETSA
jgi:hypothetical protein